MILLKVKAQVKLIMWNPQAAFKEQTLAQYNNIQKTTINKQVCKIFTLL